jgi:AIPR protein
MNPTNGQKRLYKTLCRVLDLLRAEAPAALKLYHPLPSKPDAVVQARSRALIHLFLKARFGLADFMEREQLITDGSNDGGIDAYYIDDKGKKVYVLQSKFRANAGNFVSSNLAADDLLKMDVARVLRGMRCSASGVLYNERIRKGLQKAVQRLPDAASYTTCIVLLGNAKHFSPSQLKRLIEGYIPEQYSHERVYRELLFPVVNGTYFSDPNLTIEISLSNLKGDTHLDYDARTQSARPNIKLLFVPTQEIGRVMHSYKNAILKYNPRSFLELNKNTVNKEIEKSVRNRNSNEFSLFNNGITIIADNTMISSSTAKQGTAQVVIKNPQMVNGGQTAYTLGRIYEECERKDNYSVFKGKEVLLKIITFIEPRKGKTEPARLKLIEDISKASNWQTRVDDLDRRSNDHLQIALQQEFYMRHGVYYERKKGEFSDGIHAGYLDGAALINREKLIRIALAIDFRANQARSSLKKLYEPSALAGLLRTSDVDRYAFGYEISKLIDSMKRRAPATKGDRYHVRQFGQALRYGQYAVVAVCVSVGFTANKTADVVLETVLSQWASFEGKVQTKRANAAYSKDGAFDFVNYYKGSTINDDLKAFAFAA